MAKYNDRKILKKIVNQNFTFGDFNKYLENTYNANVYCPFHEHSFSGKGNAKLYFNEEENIWVLHCFVKCGNKTAYDYLQEIVIQREGKYSSVEDFLIERLGTPEFLAQYRGIKDNIDYTKETSYQEKKRYIENLYNETDDVVDFIESLYTNTCREDEDLTSDDF